MSRDSRVEKLQRLRGERTSRPSGSYYGTRSTPYGNVQSRPRRRHSTGRTLLSLLLFVAIIAGGLYAGTRYILSYRPSAGGGSASGPAERSVVVNVQQGESVDEIAAELQNDGLIFNASIFHWYLRLFDSNVTILAGPHTLHTGMTMDQVAKALATHPPVAPTATVIIYPGWRAEEVAAALAQAGVASYKDVMHEVLQGSFNYPFLADRPAGASLEGYLLPETYIFLKHHGAHYAVGRILRTFGQEVSPSTIAAGKALYGSFYKAVTLASIVERESGTDHDKFLIASVYTNRLFHDPTLSFRLLGADPTLQYAVEHAPPWWTAPTAADKQVNSPYNTYKYPGLPPGPIAEPSLHSIEAAVHPAKTAYYYFWHRNGSHNMSIFCTAQQGPQCAGTPQ